MIVSPDNYRVIDGEYVFTDENEREVWRKSYEAWKECAGRRATMVVMVGMPRSGKSTWAQANDGDTMAIFDSTGTNEERRAPLVKIAKDGGLKVHAVVMSTPYQICRERNLKRTYGPLPDAVMQRMYERLTVPTKAEGFESVTVIPSVPWE